MRILLTSITMKTGVMTHLWELAEQLHNKGHIVRVAILKFIKGFRKTNPALLEPFKKLGIPCLQYTTAEQLTAWTTKKKIELIHAHSPISYPTAEAVANALSLPLVLTLHGVHPWQKQHASTLQRANQIIAIGPAQAKPAGATFAPKITIIENGIDTLRFKPGSWKVGQDSQTPLRVLWFGRTDPSSLPGVNALNEAVKMLRQQGKLIELKMVGTHPQQQVDQFTITGWTPDPVPFLQWGHVAFGHGRALREAMACGNVGILAGNGYGGIVKTKWLSGKTQRPLSALPQYKLPAPSADVIAKELTTLYDDRTLLINTRKHARRLALKYFDVQKMVDRTIEVYHQAMQ